MRNFFHLSVLITYDERLSEIRIINDKNDLNFIPLSINENNCLMYCNDDRMFKKMLRDILHENGYNFSLSFLEEKKKHLNSSGNNE